MTHPPGTTSTSTGLDQNVAGALAYLLGPITGIIFFLMEKENRFVRYHAAHSITVGILLIVLSIALSIIGTILAFVPILGWLVALLLSVVLGIGSFVLWILLMWRAYQGHEWELPFAGDMARKLAGEPAGTLRP